MANAGQETPSGVFPRLTPKNQERLSRILSEYLPEVITADRVIVQKTGYTSEICKTMQLDVLAHLATIAAKQHELDEDQQASQLAKIEEHLRRAIVEHPEEVVRDRISDIEELWVKYKLEAFELRRNQELHGVPRHEELEEIRRRIDALMDAARKTKPEETTWEETLTAAAQMTEAADLASQLADKLHECIGRARQITQEKQRLEDDERRRNREERGRNRRWIAGIAISIALAVGGGYKLGQGSEGPQHPPEACSPTKKDANPQSPSDDQRSVKGPTTPQTGGEANC